MIYNLNYIRISIVILLIIWLLPNNLYSQGIQEQYNQFDAQYGMDAQIYKGAKYISEHRAEFGFPFLFQNSAFIGDVVAKNFSLDSVELRYDVYKQFLVFGYYNKIGAQQQLVLNTKEIKKFHLGNNCFINNPYESINAAYLQQISNDSIGCYLAYRKDFNYINNSSKKGFGYSELVQKSYVVVNNNLYAFNGKRGLINKLPKNIQGEVGKYLSKTDIKLRKAQPHELTALFIYINSLLK